MILVGRQRGLGRLERRLGGSEVRLETRDPRFQLVRAAGFETQTNQRRVNLPVSDS